MIFYNGSSGGLGSSFGAAAVGRSVALRARLCDTGQLRNELERGWKGEPGGEVALVQMAAKVSVPDCERDPAAAFRINVEETAGTVDAFLDWASSRSLRPRVVYVSTGHVYAALPPGSRAAESAPAAPRSEYARTKFLAEGRLAGLCAKRGVPLWIARVFGLIGPRQPGHYVLPALIRRSKDGLVREIPGLDYSRDYLDSRDVCECLVALASVSAPAAVGVVNVCSGRPVTIRNLLAEVLSVVRPVDAAALLDQASAAPGREDDVPWIVGDPSRFIDLFGRDPQRIPLRQTVADAAHAL